MRLRCSVSYWWWCVVMKPGMTMVPRQSTTSASPAVRFGPTAAIVLPSIRTSACSKSPTFGSRLRTTPPRSKTRRRPSGTSSCAATPSEDDPARWAGPQETPASPAAAAERKVRRDVCVAMGAYRTPNRQPCQGKIRLPMLDTAPILWLQEWASPALTRTMLAVSACGYVPSCLAVGIVCGLGWRLRLGVTLILAIVFADAITAAAKASFASPRPFAVDARVQALGAFESDLPRLLPNTWVPDDDFGFPSGHVATTA